MMERYSEKRGSVIKIGFEPEKYLGDMVTGGYTRLNEVSFTSCTVWLCQLTNSSHIFEIRPTTPP
jgi:hypothetical protein